MTDPADQVRSRLSRLSTGIRVDPPDDDLVSAVLARIAPLPSPAPRSATGQLLALLADASRRHWRAATAVAVAVLLALVAVSPAGAKIAEWLGIGAVQIVPGPAQPTESAGSEDADGFAEVTLDQARAQVTFPLVVPAELGPPLRVMVNQDRTVVSMVWTSGDPVEPGPPVRLDQIAGRPDYAVVKRYADDIDFTQVGGADAFWLRVPHPLVYTDANGTVPSERSRIAGPTLIWTDERVTLRLEGITARDRALQIARSVG